MELFTGRFKVSPLILALIFITFFHNVLSRHRIRHFKDRFKRQQGAHLYLPGSYVTDGSTDQDAGPWEDWSEPSPCSRTCGGGVASQSRRCSEGYQCQGPSTRYFSCNTQDCQDLVDYRAQQCAEFNNIQFEGIYYDWVPYTKAPNPCELNCMPRGERFYFRHAIATVDGTRCNDEKFDVCVNGTCQPVGCDRMLGSSAREDECRVCGGDGSTCNTFQETAPMKDMQVGYNDIVLIPAGATNIRVEEMGPSNNYLAVRNSSGYYYLNGNWRIDFPRNLEFAGCNFKYERSPQEFSAPDILTCIGPTDESLFIVILYQNSDIPVSYKYSLPKNVPIPSTETYAWTYDEFTPCSASCGGGYQFRNVTCAGRNTLDPVDRNLCDSSNEPEAKRRCNEIACQAQWVLHPWKDCSAPCGEGGVRTREVSCQQIVSNGLPTLAEESECLLVQPKPPTQQKCNVGKICAQWHTDPWKPCDHLCGDGKKTRNVLCYIEKDGKIELLKESECEEIAPKPKVEEPCNIRPCEGVDWITSEWGGCERICGLKNETRKVHCATSDGHIYDDALCEADRKPEAVRKCETTNATCEYLWYASQWSECSVTCGQGVQTRTIFCGVAYENGVEEVEDEKCDPSKHFETMKNCTGEEEKCEGEWFSGPWGECSKPCGGGERSKKVACIKDLQVVEPALCGSDQIIFSQEDCNTHPCSPDTIMPTDVTHPVDESEPTAGETSISVDTTTKILGSTDQSESTKESDVTVEFEITTEPTGTSKPSDETEEYEIVPDTNCDDGEWVAAVPKPNNSEKVNKNAAMKIETEESLSIDYLMLNDGPMLGLAEETTTDFEGSGDGKSSSPSDLSSTDYEGSGTETTIIEDTFETESSYLTSLETDSTLFSTDSTITGGSTDVSTTTELDHTTDKTTGQSSTLSPSETTESTGTGTTMDVSGSDITFTTTEAETDTAGSTADESNQSTESTISGGTDNTESSISGSTVSQIPTSSKIQATQTSDVSEASATTAGTIVESNVGARAPKSETTTEQPDNTTETTESATTTLAGKTVITSSTETSSDITEPSKSSDDINTTKFPGSTETDDTGSTTAFTGSTEGFTGSTKLPTLVASSSTIEFTGSTTEISGSTTNIETSTDSSSDRTSEFTGSSTEFTGTTEISLSTKATNLTSKTSPSTTLTGSTSESTGSTAAVNGSTTEATYTSTEVSESTEINGTTSEIPDSSLKFTGSSTETDSSTTGFTETTTEFTGSTANTTEISSTIAPQTSLSTSSSGSTMESTESSAGINATSEFTSTTTLATGLSTEFTGSTTEFTGSTEIPGSTEATDFTGSTSPSTSFAGSTSESSSSTSTVNDSTTEVTDTSTEVTGPTEINGTTSEIPDSTLKYTGSSTSTTKFAETTTEFITEVSSTAQTETLETSDSEFTSSTKPSTSFSGSTMESTQSSGGISTTTIFIDTTTAATGTTTEFTGTATEITDSSEMSSSTSEIPESTHKFSSSTTEIVTSTISESTSEDTSSTTESTESSAGINATTVSTTLPTGTTTEFMGTKVEYTEISETTETANFTAFTETTTEISGNTTEIKSSTSEITGSTISVSGGSTESTVPTTEFTGSSVSVTGTSTSATASTEPDIFSSSTERGVTEESPVWDGSDKTRIMDLFTKKPRLCKRRKIKMCRKAKYGCCWDNITTAKGPFDKGCPIPRTCKESKFGCCEDGVSAALGTKQAGCPRSHCNETLFGCCPDKKTPAKGNDNEGCPPACVSSKYGCCNDNITEAKGPELEGCSTEKPEETTTAQEEITSTTELTTSTTTTTAEHVPEDCNNTTYRCCPDGITPAQGPGFVGCNLPCSNSTFGCCPDGSTAAHGPSGEGCCLSSRYGCCPDNIVASKGPNMYGCSCEFSPYGCCPDNKTSATGYNNEGCGCEYTQYACCPDNFTPAKGLGFKGCPCHTFQFGCCPDGITSAKGPQQQGCGCGNTEFGCCADEKTPASGPNMEGCGCQHSKFGCCIDGVSEAGGENFENCTDAPANLQAGCSAPKERGICRDFKVKWFFDIEYGGCSRFWYGGCGGNENRYNSKEECEQICVNPNGSDRCNLPKIAGQCEGYFPQWYYDKDLKNCAQFVYGGCLGNNNRFETREECMELCVKDDRIDGCAQKKEEGPCRGVFERYYYDKESDQCATFIYGGCKGNNNNFQNIEACKQQCTGPGRKKDHCSLPKAAGNCMEKLPRWYYDTLQNRCAPFYYSGCLGNQNNFQSREACENDCPIDIVKDACHLPAETGGCANYVERWYYNTEMEECHQFYYGGCGGNENNFETRQSCEQMCDNRTSISPTSGPQPEAEARLVPETQPEPAATQPEPTLTTMEPLKTEPQPEPLPATVEPFRTDMCFLPPETGPCRARFIKYYYDRSDGVCKNFTYGGCRGNRNNFNSPEECLQHCAAAQDICALPPVAGFCNGDYLQYYYEPSSDSCHTFSFGGCGGNHNRFADQASCEQTCRKATPVTQAPVTKAPPVPSSMEMCYQPADAGNCTEDYVAFFYDNATTSCTPFTYTGCGGNNNRFNSEEQCERQCGAFRGQDVCNMERDPGPCRGYFVKYYYDKSRSRCEQFAYGGCLGNGNRFSSNEECEHICLTHEETKPNITSTAICQLPLDQGGACEKGYHRRWYFNDQRGECLGFIYYGCGGNFNNFKSYQSCLNFCTDLLPPTEPPVPVIPDVSTIQPPHPCQEVFDECTNLRCPYGVEPYVDENECNRCRCRNPCINVICEDDEQCAIDINRNKTSSRDADFISVCRKREKPGTCPTLEQSEDNCEQECRTDADCTLHLKCCSTGCGTACVDPTPPAQLVTQQPQPGNTDSPVELELQPPKTDTIAFKPEVTGLIGDQAILRCAVTGNPNPRIAWSKDNIIIDGTQPRYRMKLDQSLQIITLHKTDSGTYLCTADNSIGEPVVNRIRLEVLDSDPRPATMLDQEDEHPVVVSLNAPTTLNCFVLGNPLPTITWWKDNAMVPLKNAEYEFRKDYSLLIHSVKLHHLGIYTCQAYNGYGKAVSWAVTVKARGPYHFTDPKDLIYKQYIVNYPEEPTPSTSTTTVTTPIINPRPPIRPTPEPYLPPNPSETSNVIEPEPAPGVGGGREPPFIVPLRVNITTSDQRYPDGSDIQVPCEVHGYPTPQVQWYKDGVQLYPSDRIEISDSNTLTIMQATKADSGNYQCEATNAYSKASSTLLISIEGMYIHPNCRDNQFLANCALIVKANLCSHRYYAKFCCRSCTQAGLLPAGHQWLSRNKENALDSNLV